MTVTGFIKQTNKELTLWCYRTTTRPPDDLAPPTYRGGTVTTILLIRPEVLYRHPEPERPSSITRLLSCELNTTNTRLNPAQLIGTVGSSDVEALVSTCSFGRIQERCFRNEQVCWCSTSHTHNESFTESIETLKEH